MCHSSRRSLVLYGTLFLAALSVPFTGRGLHDYLARTVVIVAPNPRAELFFELGEQAEDDAATPSPPSG